MRSWSGVGGIPGTITSGTKERSALDPPPTWTFIGRLDEFLMKFLLGHNIDLIREKLGNYFRKRRGLTGAVGAEHRLCENKATRKAIAAWTRPSSHRGEKPSPTSGIEVQENGEAPQELLSGG